MPIALRAALPADLARLEAIEDAADERFIDLFRPDSWWPAGSGAARAAVPGFILVAADGPGQEAVGFVHVLETAGAAHLEQLAVLPSRGRRGIGRALVQAALAEAGRRGHAAITLRTYADVPWNAPFYARCGFVETEPGTPFLEGLREAESRLGLAAHGRRVQMTASLGAS